MKITIQWNRFIPWTLILVCTLCLQSVSSAWAQDQTGDAVGANTQAQDSVDLRGDLPNPRRIDGSELRELPRVEVRTADPHDPGKELTYSGVALVEVLKAGGLVLDSKMTAIRDTIKIGCGR